MSSEGWIQKEAKEGDILFELPQVTKEMGVFFTLSTIEEAKIFAEANRFSLIKAVQVVGQPQRLEATGKEWLWTAKGWTERLSLPELLPVAAGDSAALH